MRIHIFKTGMHRASSGQQMDFDEAQLKNAVAAYNPTQHEAPVVIGHPKDNIPAFGWIKALNFDEETGNVYAEADQLNPDFTEMLEKKAFKKVSASWYLPDHPANPTPGTLHLRHVGFLGAQPPAIKGLEALSFEEATDQIVEFEDAWEDAANTSAIARVFKRWREFIIDKFSREEADAVIPEYAIEELSRSAERKFEQASKATTQADYSEDPSMDLEQALARIQALETENVALQGNLDAANNRITSFEEAEVKRQKDAVIGKVDNLIEKGFLLPAKRADVLAFCEKLDSTQTVEFGEGDSKTTISMVDHYLSQFKTPVVDFNEQAQDDGENFDSADVSTASNQIATKAMEFMEAEAAKGKHVTIQQAVTHVTANAE